MWGERIMSENKTNSANVKKTLKQKPNQNIKQHYGLQPDSRLIVKLANFNSYLKTAREVSRFVDGNRQQAMNNYAVLKKHSQIADQYAKEVWRLTLEEKYKNDTSQTGTYLSRYTSAEVPYCKLTKNGKIKPEYITEALFENSNDFNISDTIPFRVNALTTQIMQAPKTIVAETCFNAVGDHDRPCFVIRRILSCEVNDKTYMLLSDEKYYQNSPTVAFPLTLLYGGEPDGAVQLARIDSVAHLDPDTPQVLGLDGVEFIMPDYLLDKFSGNHHNVTPKGAHEHSKIKKIAAGNHIHLRDSNFELLYTLSHMSKTLTYRTEPSRFLTFNAKEIHIGEFFLDNYQTKGSYNGDFGVQLDQYKLLNEKLTDAVIKYNGLVPTELLQKFYAKTYKITNYEPNPSFCAYMDELRTFKPERLATLVDTNIIGKKNYPIYVCPENTKPNKDAKKMYGKIVDYDYTLEHNRQDIIELYKKAKEERKKLEAQNEQERNL